MKNGRVLLIVTVVGVTAIVIALAKWDPIRPTRPVPSVTKNDPVATDAPATTELIAEIKKLGGHIDANQRNAAGRTVLAISLVGARSTDADLERMRPYLQKSPLPLALQLSKLTDAGIAHLEDLTTIQELKLARTSVTDAGLAHLRGLTNLEALDLHLTQVGDPGIAHLSKLPELRLLNLHSTRVTDAGLVHLGGLAKLQELTLAGNPITDAGLRPLAGLSELRRLDLRDTKIQGSGLQHLCGLANLQELLLNGSPITDADLVPLSALNRLTYLSLLGSQVSDAALAKFKTAIPAVKIRDPFGEDFVIDKPALEPKRVVDVTQLPTDFALTADAFFLAYEMDKAAAEKRYNGRVVELGGIVDDVSVDIHGEAYLSLKADKKWVLCYPVDQRPWNKVLPGSNVKLKGMAAIDRLEACVIVEALPGKLGSVTAEQLAREITADNAAVMKRHDETHLIVSGEIVGRAVNGVGKLELFLKGDGTIRIGCSFADARSVRSMSIGQQVRVVGYFHPQAGIHLQGCLPLSSAEK